MRLQDLSGRGDKVNLFWVRASDANALATIFSVLRIELDKEIKRKSSEIAYFAALKDNPDGLAEYKTKSGLTLDICARILSEVIRDRKMIESDSGDENAIYGERELGALFNEPGKTKWDKKLGCSTTDILIVNPDDVNVLMGDCKFGLKSENAWVFRDEEQYHKEFGKKFLSVGGFLKEYDNVEASAYMLLIVTSSMVPLLINRFDDFKLDERYSNIPYDKIVICSVDDILAKASQYAA